MANKRNVLGGRLPANMLWVAASAALLLISGGGVFSAGFFTNELVSDDGGTAAVAQPTPSGGTPSAQPTAAPVVAVSVDDDPAWGPADAKVTVVEFSDYQ